MTVNLTLSLFIFPTLSVAFAVTLNFPGSKSATNSHSSSETCVAGRNGPLLILNSTLANPDPLSFAFNSNFTISPAGNLSFFSGSSISISGLSLSHTPSYFFSSGHLSLSSSRWLLILDISSISLLLPLLLPLLLL